LQCQSVVVSGLGGPAETHHAYSGYTGSYIALATAA